MRYSNACQRTYDEVLKQSIADNLPKFKLNYMVMGNGKNIKAIRPTKKLDHNMHGLFKVKQLIGPYAYKLEIPTFVGRPHPLYHLSLLELYHQNQIAGRRSPTPPLLLDLGLNEYEIESIKASQLVKGQVLYLCHWKSYSNNHKRWEPYENLMNGTKQTVRDFDLNNPY